MTTEHKITTMEELELHHNQGRHVVDAYTAEGKRVSLSPALKVQLVKNAKEMTNFESPRYFGGIMAYLRCRCRVFRLWWHDKKLKRTKNGIYGNSSNDVCVGLKYEL